jgi:hypothetical protein
MFEWIHRLLLAESEADSTRGGYLSYRAEWHAAAWGFAVAFLAGVTGSLPILLCGVGWVLTSSKDPPGWLPYPEQFAKESLYLIGHAVPGYLIGLAIRLYVLPV